MASIRVKGKSIPLWSKVRRNAGPWLRENIKLDDELQARLGDAKLRPIRRQV
jgi:hypothetical protein